MTNKLLILLQLLQLETNNSYRYYFHSPPHKRVWIHFTKTMCVVHKRKGLDDALSNGGRQGGAVVGVKINVIVALLLVPGFVSCSRCQNVRENPDVQNYKQWSPKDVYWFLCSIGYDHDDAECIRVYLEAYDLGGLVLPQVIEHDLHTMGITSSFTRKQMIEVFRQLSIRNTDFSSQPTQPPSPLKDPHMSQWRLRSVVSLTWHTFYLLLLVLLVIIYFLFHKYGIRPKSLKEFLNFREFQWPVNSIECMIYNFRHFSPNYILVIGSTVLLCLIHFADTGYFILSMFLCFLHMCFRKRPLTVEETFSLAFVCDDLLRILCAAS